MGLSGVYNSPVAEEDGITILIDAFHKGITFFDTADRYGANANEVLVGKVCVTQIVNLRIWLFIIYKLINS